MSDGMDELRANTREDDVSDVRLTDDDDELDSVMSFSDGDSVADADSDDDAPEGTKTLSKLRKKQTSNLAQLEEVYHRRRNRMRFESDDDADSESDEKAAETPRSRERPKTAPVRNRITIPKPFGFDQRDNNAKAKAAADAASISKRRFHEYLSDLKRAEDAHLNFEFKANPVPLSAVTSRMAPGPKRAVTPPKEPFKAKDVPWFVKVKLYDAMKAEQSTKRKVAIQRRADKLLAKSSLPPRMRRYETAQNRALKKRKLREIAKEAHKEFTFAPKINHCVPDFGAEQAEFRRQLEERKEARETVKAEAFSFCDRPSKAEAKAQLARALAEDAKVKAREREDESAVAAKLRENRRRSKAMLGRAPKIMPKSTRKFDEAVSAKKARRRKVKMEAFMEGEAQRAKERATKRKWKGVLEVHLVDNSSLLE